MHKIAEVLRSSPEIFHLSLVFLTSERYFTQIFFKRISKLKHRNILYKTVTSLYKFLWKGSQGVPSTHRKQLVCQLGLHHWKYIIYMLKIEEVFTTFSLTWETFVIVTVLYLCELLNFLLKHGWLFSLPDDIEHPLSNATSLVCLLFSFSFGVCLILAWSKQLIWIAGNLL